MAKFYGNVGFLETVETRPGIWEKVEKAHPYRGDLLRNQRRWEKGTSTNDDLVVSNEVSIVADDFLRENAGTIQWVEVLGSKWKVTSMLLDYPRVTLTLGGLYNGS